MTEEKKDIYDDMVEWCDHDMKLAVTKWVMKHIVDHAEEGGSYRYLIYDRLGFGPEAYAPLCSDGMTISNEFDLSLKQQVAKYLKNNDIEGAKKALGYCDSAGCFNEASSGYPTKDGYRHSCIEHYKEYEDGKEND
jgi:hypothetical protein